MSKVLIASTTPWQYDISAIQVKTDNICDTINDSSGSTKISPRQIDIPNLLRAIKTIPHEELRQIVEELKDHLEIIKL